MSCVEGEAKLTGQSEDSGVSCLSTAPGAPVLPFCMTPLLDSKRNAWKSVHWNTCVKINYFTSFLDFQLLKTLSQAEAQ